MTPLSAEVAEAVRLRDTADNGPWLHKNAGPYDNGMTAGGLPGVWSSLWPTTDTPSICSVHYKENAALIAAAPSHVDLIHRLHARVRELEQTSGETPEYHAECFRHKATKESLDGCIQKVAALARELEQAREEVEHWKRQSRANWDAARELTDAALKP